MSVIKPLHDLMVRELEFETDTLESDGRASWFTQPVVFAESSKYGTLLEVREVPIGTDQLLLKISAPVCELSDEKLWGKFFANDYVRQHSERIYGEMMRLQQNCTVSWLDLCATDKQALLYYRMNLIVPRQTTAFDLIVTNIAAVGNDVGQTLLDTLILWAYDGAL